MPPGKKGEIRTLIVLCIVWISPFVSAQNLVPNPSFEVFDVCPAGLSGGPLNCIPWVNPTLGTSDYFNECSFGAADVPDNTFGFQDAHTGVAYAGGYYYAGGILFDYREYLQIRLTEPLAAGTTYNVSLWYSLADDFGCPMNQLGIYVSVNPPSEPGNNMDLDYEPQIQYTGGLITNTTTWLLFSQCYVASGGEEYITIGNFYSDTETDADPLCASGGFSYLFIDDVSVVENGEPPGTIDFDLGDDVETCGSVTLDPGLGNVSYTWSNGSHDPTLTVTTSGIYYLSVTSGCDFGVDSIEVTIVPPSPPVDLGPDLLLCPGEEIDIVLDDALGEYTWQDNSTGATYSINAPGIYSVTLDDGCSLSSDEIEILEIQPPDPISLGNDTILCNGETYTLTFDAELGDFEWQDGSTGATYTISMPGSYALTVSNQCGSVSDATEVEFLADPIITFPNELLVACPGDIIVLDFDPDLGDYEWQDGSTESSYEVTQEGEYSVSVTNLCGSDFDQIYVDFLEEPQLELGDDIILCPSQLPYLFDLSEIDHAEEYFWQDGSDGGVYEAQQAGTYSVTVSNDCFTVSDEIEIVVEDVEPEVMLPADITLCAGETLLLNVESTSEEYVWSDGSTDATLLVTQSGVYAVTVSNLCGTGSDSVLVVYEEALPNLNLGADLNICPGEIILLQPGIPDVSYLWQDGSTNTTYQINAADTIILTISNSCEESSDTLFVTANSAPPDLILPDSVLICQGDTIALSTILIGVMYAWSTGDSTQSIEVNSSGIYSLTVSNTCGMDTGVVVVADGGSAPTVDLGDDFSLCPGSSFIIDANVTNGTILWSDGSTATSYIATEPGQITIQVNNLCATVYDTIQVYALNETPPLFLGPDITLCPGEFLTLDPGVSNVEYLWQDGSIGSSLIVSNAGIYSLEISDTCGVSRDTISIMYEPDAPLLDLGPDVALCLGETILFAPQISGVSYLWQDGSTGSTFLASQPGLVHVTAMSTCWQVSDTILISEDLAGPMIELGNDTMVCAGGSVLVSSGILGVDYLWNDGSSDPNLLVTSTQEVILHVSNACGSDSDTIVVTVDGTPPSVLLGQDTILCEGSSFTLVPILTGEDTFQWQDGSQTRDYVITLPGLYFLEATNRCGTNADSILVAGIALPAPFSLGNDTTLCSGTALTLQAPSGNAILQWSTGSSDSEITIASGSIWLEITNICGSASDTISVFTDMNQPDVSIDPLYTICSGETVVLDISQPFHAQYLWSTGSTQPILTVSTAGMYQVTVSTQCETLEADTEIIEEECDTISVHVFVPNVFSPNGDNINDVFRPVLSLPEIISDYQLNIFDRWGEVVFSSEEISDGWDGTLQNTPLNPGVFVYVIRYRDTSLPASITNTFTIHGDVTLIR